MFELRFAKKSNLGGSFFKPFVAASEDFKSELNIEFEFGWNRVDIGVELGRPNVPFAGNTFDVEGPWLLEAKGLEGFAAEFC